MSKDRFTRHATHLRPIRQPQVANDNRHQEVDMYEQAFNFISRPFTPLPFVDHYFPGQAMHQALGQTRVCIERANGPVIAIGSTGSGKSLLLQVLQNEYRDQFNVVLLDCARLAERHDLFQNILFELDQPYRNMSEGELRLSLMDFLRPGKLCPNGMLLLVDDAHSLSIDLLDEIRLLTNLVRDGQPRVRLVMAANQQLEDNLMRSQLESFNQRIAARCYLASLSRSDTREYVAAHLKRAGADCDEIFEDNCLREVHQLTDGCPRLINQLCEHGFILAAENGVTRLDSDFIREAWQSLQNIPGAIVAGNPQPANPQTESSENNSWSVVEFGELDDEDNQSSQPTEKATAFESPGPAEWPSSDLEPATHDFEQSTNFEQPTPVDQPTVFDQPTPVDQPVAFEQPTPFDQPADIDQPAAIERPGPSTAEPSAYEIRPQSDSTFIDFDDEPESNTVGETLMRLEPVEPESFIEPKSSNVVESPATPDSCETSGNRATPDDNPFNEHFDNVESVADPFMPVFADQNISSLTVSKSDLESINPQNDDSVPASTPENFESSEPFAVARSANTTIIDGFDDMGEEPIQTLNDEDSNSSSTITLRDEMETVSQEEWRNIMESIENGDGDDRTPNISVVDLPDSVPDSSDVSLENHDSSAPPVHEPVQHLSIEPGEEEAISWPNLEPETNQHVQPTQEEQILDDLRGQIKALQNDAPGSGQDSAASEPDSPVSIEYPTATVQSTPTTQDDRDMLIVTQSATKPTVSENEDFEPEPDSQPASTGRAKRMDYQDLFDQLRNVQDDRQ